MFRVGRDMQPRKLLWLSLLIVASLLVPAFLQFYVVPPQVAMASPASQRLSPDVLILQTNLAGSISDIQDDPDSPDTNWLDASVNNEDTVCHVSFPTPAGNPIAGADLQEFKIWVKKWDGTGTPTVRIDLYENGALVATVMAASDVTSSAGQLFSATWNANLLSNADGSQVECYIYGTAVGGKPATRATVCVGAVEWNVDYIAAPTVGTIAISPSSMTPQEQWTNITVPVTDNDTLADVNEVHVEVFYDSAGNDPSAPGTANVQTCAILIWTRGGSPEWDIAPASTTWAINAVGCSNGTDSLTTDNWVFSFKVGKVATQSPGTDDWDIYAKATDSVSQTGDNYLRDVEMNWYGEITVETSTVSWGIVSPGCSNETSPVMNITYICNGNYAEQIKTSQNWTSASGNVTLNTTGSPGTGEFSLKADDDDTLADAVQVLSASYTTFNTGTQTTEAGNAENNNHLWLSLGSSGITYDTYSGTFYFGIAS
jgi:hypothetical protein